MVEHEVFASGLSHQRSRFTLYSCRIVLQGINAVKDLVICRSIQIVGLRLLHCADLRCGQAAWARGSTPQHSLNSLSASEIRSLESESVGKSFNCSFTDGVGAHSVTFRWEVLAEKNKMTTIEEGRTFVRESCRSSAQPVPVSASSGKRRMIVREET